MRARASNWFVAVVAALATVGGVASTAYAYENTVYKPRARICDGCIGLSDRYRISENAYVVIDCGGYSNDKCQNEIWEQDRYGNKYYATVRSGLQDVVWSHYRDPRWGRAACQSHSTFTQDVYGYCYVVRGYA